MVQLSAQERVGTATDWSTVDPNPA